ncbi:MAG: 4Fe-4S binding protein, partial [Chloroflexi bacterium]|nr:4Fe-4S binding protein [Chloroflexota bacterium]
MSTIIINEELCKGCELCTLACPKDLIILAKHLTAKGYHPAMLDPEKADKCTSCVLCARVCPDIAIEVYRRVVHGSSER